MVSFFVMLYLDVSDFSYLSVLGLYALVQSSLFKLAVWGSRLILLQIEPFQGCMWGSFHSMVWRPDTQYVHILREHLLVKLMSLRMSSHSRLKIAFDIQGGKVSNRDRSWDLRVRSHQCPQLWLVWPDALSGPMFVSLWGWAICYLLCISVGTVSPWGCFEGIPLR